MYYYFKNLDYWVFNFDIFKYMYLIKEKKNIYDIISEIYIYFLLKLWYLYDDKIFLL